MSWGEQAGWGMGRLTHERAMHRLWDREGGPACVQEPPFRDPKLLPMSPPRARWLVGSPRSPIANGLAGSSFRNR